MELGVCVGGGVSRYPVWGAGACPMFSGPQQGVQPTASTLALWWLKFGPTGGFWYGRDKFIVETVARLCPDSGAIFVHLPPRPLL